MATGSYSLPSQCQWWKLLAEIVADTNRLLEVARQAQAILSTDTDERQMIVEVEEMLGQLLVQGVKRVGDVVAVYVEEDLPTVFMSTDPPRKCEELRVVTNSQSCEAPSLQRHSLSKFS